jgi:hypothetical protein
MPTITRFAVRSNGRVLADVRRPNRERMAVKAGVAPIESLKKADLVKLAEERGVDASGTKAELTERLGTVV